MTFWKKIGNSFVLSLLIVISTSPIATALQSTSANYGIDQAVFGSGGELNACSASYCAHQSVGETAAGNSTSANYQIQAGGTETDRQPYIEFIVNGTNTDVGTLTTTTTATTTGTFSVKTYLASGYTVVNAAAGPQNSGYVMNGLTSATASSPGTEQFGINLVANTAGCGAPATFGAAPSQAPDSTFSFGQAAPGYNTCGLFKYVNGDVVALSNSSSGTTNYTISYIFNISPITPGGVYTFHHVLVATSTF